ncbi:ABATE domain-containing protein [Agromyces endophyticus]|uniref:CGNR zinc finger domain-containing protein n=1 Tax=Agromyces sp. H17E-10 TaxID=2932244 RepID=UPI001FD36D71|nr:CGNR zinc finger domain-containing protein [Agromyces sp. H17E-10]UOQ91096.1 ABATE domain-containing protein [Agromyces sp. H17E-10]
MQFAFPCGHPVLDFVGTLQARREPAPVERFETPADVDTWFVESGLADHAPGFGARDREHAIALREAIYLLVRERMNGRRLDDEACTELNRVASARPATLQLGDDGVTIEATPAQALSTLARQAIELIAGPETTKIKECGRPVCTQVYLDDSRGGRREWCSMDTCGSRMKAAAYRARKRAVAASA